LEQGLTRLEFDENWRSSQAICDVAYRFSTRIKPDIAVGPNAKRGIAPELVVYPDKDPSFCLEVFENRLKRLRLESTSGVVLTRSRHTRARINGQPMLDDLQPAVRALGNLAGEFQTSGRVERKSLESVERLLATFAWDVHPSELSEEVRLQLRDASVALLAELKDLAKSLDVWVEGARESVKEILTQLTKQPAKSPSGSIRKKAGFENINAADMFAWVPKALEARTVHEVKGESHEAVLVVLDPPTRRVDQTELWASHLRGTELTHENAEELRIGYVALTRAEVYCGVAVPLTTEEQVVRVFLDAGFADRR
jgi:DNA helicase II / ATP-dependent DNA helicase PcrA